MSSSYIYVIPIQGPLRNITEYGDIGGWGNPMIRVFDLIQKKYGISNNSDIKASQHEKLVNDPHVPEKIRALILFAYEKYVLFENIPRLINVLEYYTDQYVGNETELGSFPKYIQYLKDIMNGKYGNELFGVCFAHHDDNDDFYTNPVTHKYFSKEEIVVNKEEIFESISPKSIE